VVAVSPCTTTMHRKEDRRFAPNEFCESTVPVTIQVPLPLARSLSNFAVEEAFSCCFTGLRSWR
jgi:hypothetical protein